ncbi:hypothetical protein [Sporosarcina sp. E16_8]|uniref:hypothetical protein n=1 Tax=Sporosarcina sp. E16_8 TaxID=2789295 RepID=UPI001A93146C|nr:hypothetical protein [Sporosarcina sp. E16_8]MBO0589139.1 hypothetical protein [Sporosarcina sp. E16_8]
MQTTIIESYERDVTNGDAYSRSRWFSYAIGTVGASIVGTKGAAAVTKTGVTTTKVAVQKGVTATQNAVHSPALANLFPYGPHRQVAMPGGVPYNVMNGPGVRNQLISKVKLEVEVKSTVNSKYSHNMVEKPGPLLGLNPAAATTFRSGMYNVTKLESDTILYRSGKAGGGKNALGQYFTKEPGTKIGGRIDSAVKAQ